MKSKIAISIPKPCHENWDAMTQGGKGRFCGSCQKQVFDFTKASDKVIADTFNQNGNLCGRFTISQLDRDLVIPRKKKSMWIAAASAFVSFITLGAQEAAAQGEPQIVQTDKKNISEKALPANDTIIVNGTVVSDKLALPGVQVSIKNSNPAIWTQTDFDGKFSLHCPQDSVLQFIFSGVHTQEFTVAASQTINVQMIEDHDAFPNIAVGGAVARRTFFGRIFNAIGNIFR